MQNYKKVVSEVNPLESARCTVDVPHPVLLIKHLYVNGVWCGVAPRTDTRKTCVFTIDWITCSIYYDHSKPSS